MKKLLSAFAFFAVCTLYVCSACTSKDKSVAASSEVASQSSTTETTNEDGLNTDDKPQIAECKAFLEEFYKGLEEDFLNYDFIRKHITSKAEQFLKDAYDYECEDGDCMATWLFAYEGGGDVGTLSERNIEVIDANTYKVLSIYDQGDGEDYKYGVKLGIVKEGDAYKINTLETVLSQYSVEEKE